MMLTRATCVLFLAVSGCGGDGGGAGSGDPVSSEEAASLCNDFTAHATTCGWGGNVNGYDWNCGEAGLVWRADAFRAFAQCATALACTGDGASCMAAALDAVTPIAVHDEYAASCSAREAECGLPAGLCSADRYELYTTAAVQPLLACFDETCQQITTCLESSL